MTLAEKIFADKVGPEVYEKTPDREKAFFFDLMEKFGRERSLNFVKWGTTHIDTSGVKTTEALYELYLIECKKSAQPES